MPPSSAVRPFRAVLVALVAIVTLLPVAGAHAAQPGALAPLTGAQGCWTNEVDGFCTFGKGLGTAANTVVSADGRYVYVTGQNANYQSLAVFRRKRAGAEDAGLPGAVGSLAQIACYNRDASGGCVGVRGMRDPATVAVSGDGANVYVASASDSAIAVFQPNTDGTLSQPSGAAGCLAVSAYDDCGPLRFLSDVADMVVTRDGKNVYAAGWSSEQMSVLKRNTDPGAGPVGALEQLPGKAGCVSPASDQCTPVRGGDNFTDLALSPDPSSQNLYALGYYSHSVSAFKRNADGSLEQLPEEAGCIRGDTYDNRCATQSRMSYPESLVVSPNGEQIYVAARDGVQVIDRQPDGSMQTRPGSGSCLTYYGTSGACDKGRGLYYAHDLEIAPDGSNVYVSSTEDNALTSFTVKEDGGLRRLVGTSSCMSQSGGYYNPYGGGGTNAFCATFASSEGSESLAFSHGDTLAMAPDGLTLYAAGREASKLAILERVPGPAAGAPTGRTWDFAEDMKTAAAGDNPGDDRYGASDVWSYGYATTSGDGSDFTGSRTLLENRFNNSVGHRGWYWPSDSNLQVAVLDNVNGYTHPGPGRVSATGWTNPYASAATVNIAGQVAPDNPGCGDGIAWRLTEGATVLRSGTIPRGGQAQGFELDESVAAGATVFLVVAPRGSYDCDATELDLRITGPTETEPQTAIVSGPQGLREGRSHDFKLTSNLPAAQATFECQLDGGEWTACGGAAGDANPYPRTHTATGLTDGPHTLRVRAVNSGLNVRDTTPATRTFTIDDTDPETTITGGPTGRTRDTSPRFTFEASEAGRTECRLDGAGETGWSRCFSPVDTGELAEGAHWFEVRSVDKAGNVDLSPARNELTIDSTVPKLQPGALRQLRGADGCSSHDGSQGCRDDRRLDWVSQSAVSRDGRHVYATGHSANAVVVYDRAKGTPEAPGDGRLTQKAGTAGCLNLYAEDGCAGGNRALSGAWSIVVSPDDRHVYVAGYYDNAIAVFTRDTDPLSPGYGTLTQAPGAAGCIVNGSGSDCRPGRALENPRHLAISPDGRTLYAANPNYGRVAVLDRDTGTGALTQAAGAAGCISDNGSAGCADVRALAHPRRLTVSPDGRNLYVASTDSQAVATFARSTEGDTLGDLTQLKGEQGCIREGGGERCRAGKGLSRPRGVAVSPDGQNLYVASYTHGLAVLERDQRSGALSQRSGRDGCFKPYETTNDCETARASEYSESVAVSPDGQSVYVDSSNYNGFTILRRASDGRLTPLTGRDACFSENGNYYGYDRRNSCRTARGLNPETGDSITIAPDGRNVYVASPEANAISAYERSLPTSASNPQPLEWDAANDFQRSGTGVNPGRDGYGNTPWFFGSGRDKAADAFTSFRADAPGELRHGWLNAGDDTFGVGLEDSGRFHMYPEAGGRPAVVGWTNPLATRTRFEVHLLVEDNQPHGWGTQYDGIDWHLEQGTTRLGGGTQRSGDAAHSLDREVELDPGETLWLTVGRRASNDYDATIADFHITALNAAEAAPQTVVAKGPQGQTNETSPVYTVGTKTAGASFECRVDGLPAGWSEAACGTVTEAPDQERTDAGLAVLKRMAIGPLSGQGTHTFEVRAVSGGTPDPSPSTRTIELDTVAPTVALTSAPSGKIRDPQPRFEFTATDSAYTECRIDPAAGAGADDGWSECFSPRQLPELADGEHTHQIRAADHAGNVGPVTSRTFTIDTGAASLQPGALSQLIGDKGCVSETGGLPDGATCADGRGLDEPQGGAFTSDGQYVYVAARNSSTVSAYRRNTTTGELTQLPGAAGCVSNDGSNGCTDGRALHGAYDVAVSPDDKHVYVAARDQSALVIFERNTDQTDDVPDGALRQLDDEAGCIRHESNDNGCASARALYGAQTVEVSPDGEDVYVGAMDGASIGVFQRAADGSLTQRDGAAGCLQEHGGSGCADGRAMYGVDRVVIAPDGRYVYATGHHSHSVAVFERKGDGSLAQLPGDAGCVRVDGHEGCADVRGTTYPRGLAISPDGENLYVASEGDYALTTLRVEPDGGLSQESGKDGCYRYDNADGCRDGERLDALTGVAVSPDGRSVYAISHSTDAVTAFSRDAEGRLRQLNGADACWANNGHNGRCRDGKGLDFGWGDTILIPKDGRHLLTLGGGSDAIDVFARRAPASLNGPDDLVWDLGRDFLNQAGHPNPAPDRFGHDDVWHYRKGVGTDGPGATGTAWPALGSFRLKNHFCETRSWMDTANDDHPFIKPDCEDRAHVHPDVGEPFAAGWRNPLGRAATVNLSMLVSDPWDAGGDGIRWSVLRGDPAAGGAEIQPPTTLSPNGRAQNLDTSIDVAAGELLWFVVEPLGNANADSTVLDVTISGVAESGPQTTLVRKPANLATQARPEYVVGSEAASATFACRIDGAAAGFTAEQCGDVAAPQAADTAGRDLTGLQTVRKLTLPTLADAAHTIEIRATSGEATDRSPATDELRIDSTAPNTIVENGPDGLTRDRTPRYELTMAPTEQGSYFECRTGEDAGTWTRCASPYTLAALTDGPHVFEVRAVDRIGNRDATPERRELQVDTAVSGLQFGGLMQLSGAAGCVSQTGLLPSGEPCTDGRGLDGATAVTVSADGRFAYVASHEGDSVSVYSRAADGALTPVADSATASFCISDNGLAGEGCVLGRGLDSPTDLELSPDGEQLYVSSYSSGSVAVIDVDKSTGAISQAPDATGCLAGSDGDCTPGRELYGAISLEVAADKVYVATEAYDSILVLDRDPASGDLAWIDGQAGCVNDGGYYGCADARAINDISDLELAGGQLYSVSYYSGVAVFDIGSDGALTQPDGEEGCVRDRDMGAGENCRQAVGIGYPRTIAAAPSGTHLYVGGEWSTIGILNRDTTTGELTQVGNPSRCVAETGDGSATGCDDGRVLNVVRSIEVAPDGRHVYAASDTSNGIATFRRSADGTLRQLTGLDGCTTDSGSNGTCRDGRGLDVAPYASSVAVSPDNASVYVVGRGHDAVAAFARRVPRSAAALVSEWDAAEDFDTSEAGANPAPDRGGNSGVWTYLEGNGKPDGTERNPSAYTILPRFVAAGAGRWSPQDRDYPWAHLETGKRGLLLTPENGATGKPSVLRWRNPADDAITVQVHLNLSDVNSCGDGVRWIAERGTLNTATNAVTNVSRLGGGWFGDGGRAQTLDRTLTVEPNEIIDVVVTNRTGEHCSDDTRVELNISALPLTNTEMTEVPPTLTRDDTPAFRLRNIESDAATFQCIVRPGTSTTPPAEPDWVGKACDAAFQAPELADGRYVFFARSLLNGVAERRPAAYAFKVDSTAPAVSLGAPPADTNDTRPPLAGTAGSATTTDTTAADNEAVVVNVYRPAHGSQGEQLVDSRTLTRGAAGAFGPVDVATDLAPGRYVARAEQEDAAGNKGVSADRAFRIDTTRPVVAITHPDIANASRLARPTITGTAGKRAGATVADPAQDVDSRDDTEVTVNLFEGTSTDNLQVGCAAGDEDGSCPFTGTVLPDGTFTATLPGDRASLADGIYTARVVQRDAAGNASTAVTRSFKVDTVAPAVTFTEAGTPGAVTRDRSPGFSGRAGSALGNDPAQSRDADEVRLRIFRGTNGEGDEVDLDPSAAGVQGLEVDREGDGDFSFDGSYPDLADGTYHAIAEQSDLATNVGRTTPGHTFKVDRTPPRPTSNMTAQITRDRTPTLMGLAGIATGLETDKAKDEPPVTVHLFRGTEQDEAQRIDLDPAGSATTGTAVPIGVAGLWLFPVPADLTDGTYTVVADQADAAGNSGLGEAFSFKVDATAPSPSVGTVPAKTADRTPQLQGTAGTLDGTAADSVADDTSVTVRVARTHGDALVEEFDAHVNAATGEWSGTPESDLPDGTYAVSVVQEDELDNAGSGSGANLMKVDATGPVPVVNDPFSPTADDTPTFDGTYERRDGSAVDSVMDHSPVEVKVTGAGGFSRTIQAEESDGAWTATPATELPDGTYSVVATQRDELLNEGTSTPARTIKVDSTKPLPAVDPVAVETNDRSPSFAGDAGNETGDDPDAVADASTVTVVVERTSIGEAVRRQLSPTRTAGGRWSVDVPDTAESRLPDGTYRVTVAQSDAVGNDSGERSARTFKVDATAPQPTVDASVAGATRETRPSLTGTRGTQAADETAVADRSALTVEVDPVKAGEPTITKTFTDDDTSEEWGVQLDQPLADGSYDVTVVQRDLLDNERRSATVRRLKVDATAPSPTLAQPASPMDVRRPTIAGTRGVQANTDDAVADSSTLTIEIDPMAPGATRTQTVVDDDATAGWVAELDEPLADGTYELRVLQSDTLGNERASSPARTLKIDDTAPVPAITTAPAETADRTPSVAGTAGSEDGSDEDAVADYPKVTVTVTRTHGHAIQHALEADVDPATGAWQAALPELVDGTWSLSVAQRDALGNDRTVTHGTTMKVDGKAPLPTVDAVTTPTKQRKPTFTGRFEQADGTNVVSVADRSDVAVVAKKGATEVLTDVVTNPDGTWSAVPKSDLGDGTWSVTATQSDTLDNLGTSDARTIKVDGTAPLPTVDTRAAETNDRTPTFSGDAGAKTGDEADAVADAGQVTVVVEKTAGGGDAVRRELTVDRTSGRWETTLEDSDAQRLPDGTYEVTVAQKDALDNASGARSARTFKVDGSAPAPAVDAAVTRATKDRRPAFTGTRGTQAPTASASADSASLTLTVDPVGEGATRTRTFTDDAGESWSAQLDDPLADGSYDVTVTQGDDAGNTGTSTVVRRIKVDATAPAPALAQPDSPTRERKPALSGTRGTQADALDAVDDVKSVTVEIDPLKPGEPTRTQVVADDDATAAWAADVAVDLPDGSYDLTPVQADALGNEGRGTARRVKVDRTAPAPTLDDPPARTKEKRPELKGRAGDAAETDSTVADLRTGMTLRITRTSTGASFDVPVTAAADHGWSATPDRDLVDGTYAAKILQVDALGNAGESTAKTFKVDRTAPQPSITSGSLFATRTPTLGGAKGADADGEDRVNDAHHLKLTITRTDAAMTPVVQEFDDQTGTTWSRKLDKQLADGSYQAVVEQSDEVGNPGLSSPPHAFKVDATAPAPTVDGGAAATSDDTPAFAGDAGTAAEGATTSPDLAPVTVTVRRANSNAAPVTKTVTAAGGRWTAQFDELADGTYLITAEQSDTAGNTGTSTPRELEIDSIAPPVSLDVPADTNAERPAISGTGGRKNGALDDEVADGDVSVELQRVGGGDPITLTAKVDEGTNWSVAPSDTIPAGRWRVVATQADAVGNRSTTDPRFFDVDRTAPALAVDALGSPSNDATPTISGDGGILDGTADGVTADARAVTVRVTRGTAEVPLTAATGDDGRWSVTVPEASKLSGDGTWTVTATQSDAVGNVAQKTRTFVLDTTAPVTTIATKPGAFTGDSTPRFTFTADEATSRFECSVDDAAFAACPTPFDLEQLADGPHTLEVRAVDVAGNTDESPASHDFTVDTVDPTTSITTTVKSGEDEYNKLPVAFTSSSNEEGTFECRLVGPGTANADAQFGACAATKTYTTLDDGRYRFESRAIDRAGNATDPAATHEFNVDTVAPDTTLEANWPKTLTNDATPEIRFTSPATDLASFECRVDSSLETAFAPCVSGSSLTSLSDGQHTVEVRAIDRAGNPDPQPASRTFTVDTRRPVTSIDEQPEVLRNQRTARFRFASDETGSTFVCRLDDATEFTACPATHDVTVSSDGEHTLRVRAIDAAGNEDDDTLTRTWTVDTVAPAPTVTAPSADDLADRRPRLAGAAGDATAPSIDTATVTVHVYRGTGTAEADRVLTLSPARDAATWEATPTTDLADGTYTAQAVQTDAAGNRGESPTRRFRVDATAPVVTWTTAAGPTRDSTPTLAGTAGNETGADADAVADATKIPVKLTRAAVPAFALDLEATRTAGGTFSVTVPAGDALADGTYVVEATQEDALGNESTPKTIELVVDTTAPVVSLTSAPRVKAPAFTITGGALAAGESRSADASTVKVRLFQGTGTGGQELPSIDVQRANGAFAFAWPQGRPALADGTYTAVAEQRDGAQNEGASSPVTFTVDTVAPVPAVTSFASPTNDRTPELRGTLSGGAGDALTGTVELAKDLKTYTFPVTADESGDWVVDDSDWGTDALAENASDDGDWTVRVRQADGAGNTGSAQTTLRYDRTAPAVGITAGPMGTTKATTALFVTNAEPGADVVCTIDGTVRPCATATTVAAGPHTFVARATDAAGNTATATREWTVDTSSDEQTAGGAFPPGGEAKLLGSGTAPTTEQPLSLTVDLPAGVGGDVSITERPAPSTSPLAGFQVAGRQLSITAPDGTAASPLRFVLELDSSLLTNGVTWENVTLLRTDDDGDTVALGECGSVPCIDDRDLLPGGDVRLVVLTDHASVWTFAKDSLAPTASVTDGPAGEVTVRDASFRFTATEAATFQCRMDDEAFAACTSPKAYTGLAEGEHRFEVRATDRAGNVGPAASRTFTVRLPKQIAQPAVDQPAQPGPEQQQPAPGPRPQPGPAPLNAAQMQAIAQRILKTSKLSALPLRLGSARAYGPKTLSSGRLVLERGQSRAPLFAVVCPVACTVSTKPEITIGSRRHALAPQRMTFAGAGGGVIALRLPAALVNRLKKAGPGRLSISVQVADTAGNRIRAMRQLRVSVRKR